MAELRITNEYVYKAKQNQYNRTCFFKLKHATLVSMAANQQKGKNGLFLTIYAVTIHIVRPALLHRHKSIF